MPFAFRTADLFGNSGGVCYRHVHTYIHTGCACSVAADNRTYMSSYLLPCMYLSFTMVILVVESTAEI